MSSPITLSQPPAFGFELFQCHNESDYRKCNVGKCYGYIPLLGMLFGLARIFDVSRSKLLITFQGLTLAGRVRHIIRGTIEFLNLGILLLIPDLILTAYRACQKPTPITIGSAEHPFTKEEIIAALKQKQNENGSKPVDTIIIYAKGCLFKTDPGFFSLKPNKVILVGGFCDDTLLANVNPPTWYQFDRQYSNAKTFEEALTQHRPIHECSKRPAQCLYMVPAQTPKVDELP